MTESIDHGFFSPPNELKLEALTGAPGELVTRLLSRTERGSRSLLPSRLGPITRWYGAAPNSREERILREEFRSWLGPPITDSLVTVTAPRDDMDQLALSAFGGWSILSADVNDSWQESARDAVTNLLDVWSLAPDRSVDAPRPVGRVLRQFYESLLASAREDAEAALTELRIRSLLNATNLRFLRVQMLAELDSPEALRDDPQLQGLTLLARPPAVTERLADAADALVIRPAVDAGRPLETIGSDLESSWPGLATERHQVTTLATARCFALAEITLPNPNSALLTEIAQRFPDDSVLGAVAGRWGRPVEPVTPVSAVEHYHRGEYDQALTAAEREEPTRPTVGIALAAAVNLATGEAASRALLLFEGLELSDRETLAKNAVEAVFLERLRMLTSRSRKPTGWLDWLRGDWTDRPDLLDEWSRAWAPGLEPADATAEIVIELLDALNDERRGRIRNGLPVFVNAVLGSELSPASVPLAVTLLDILLSSEPGRIERHAALALLDEILLVGCTAPEYEEILNAFERQLPLIGPRDASWLIQVLDLLLVHSSPDNEKRDAVLIAARITALAWRERLDPLDYELLAQLFPNEGFDPKPTLADPEVSEWRPRSVGIYSLLESATRHAIDLIHSRWPEVDIRTSSEHVNTDALMAMARGVDVVLVQTSHAKHAATEALEAAIPDRSRLVLVNGRGATSLVRALVTWAETTQHP